MFFCGFATVLYGLEKGCILGVSIRVEGFPSVSPASRLQHREFYPPVRKHNT